MSDERTTSWAREALEGGEITQEQYDHAVEGGRKIMAAKPTWRPAPGEAPPPAHPPRVVDPLLDLRRWCKDNPGEWAVAESTPIKTQYKRLRRHGFHVVSRHTKPDENDVLHGDLWVCWPAVDAAAGAE